jgi:hypothetical protein
MRRLTAIGLLSLGLFGIGMAVAVAVWGGHANADTSVPAISANMVAVPERIMGNPNAPVTVEEYVSLTCTHCADFYNNILPELEKKYVETGKVRFILRDFPLDGVALKAATLARCMPEDSYYPFVKTLYHNLLQWASAQNVDKILIQYAGLGGLSEDRAKACLADTAMQDALVAARANASDKLKIEVTPTFVINYGVEKLQGAMPAADFAAAFDRVLAAKK